MAHHHQRLPLLQPLHLHPFLRQHLRRRRSHPKQPCPVVVGAEVGIGRETPRGAPLQEEQRLVAQVGVHAAEGLVQHHEVWFAEQGAEEQREALGAEGEGAEGELVGPVRR